MLVRSRWISRQASFRVLRFLLLLDPVAVAFAQLLSVSSVDQITVQLLEQLQNKVIVRGLAHASDQMGLATTGGPRNHDHVTCPRWREAFLILNAVSQSVPILPRCGGVSLYQRMFHNKQVNVASETPKLDAILVLQIVQLPAQL